jgi:aspartate aminotransferase
VIRQAQILFDRRADRDRVRCINLAIGNVSLPMHPALQRRLRSLGEPGSPFAEGVVMYSPSVGLPETRRAMLHVISAAGLPTDGLDVLVTDGASASMELMVLGVAGPASERPLVLIDPIYTIYADMCRRGGVPFVAVPRELRPDGCFTRPDLEALDRLCRAERPCALVVCPSDNPTGQFLNRGDLADIARLSVRHDLWLVSDEAYRQLHYTGEPASSVWALDEVTVPGITGRRISIESASKVWNACGLRVGGIVTDSPEFHAKAVAEYTANLCANVIGQWIFAALVDESPEALTAWYSQQCRYYVEMMRGLRDGLQRAVPGIIVSQPLAALYSVIDLVNVVAPSFDAAAFACDCAERGGIDVEGRTYTLLLAPMSGFYAAPHTPASRTQLRVAYVETPERTALVPAIFAALLERYQAAHG